MEFVDFSEMTRGRGIGLLFPGWQPGESVAFLSPHDDDVALGAGYLVQAVSENGGTAVILVFCRGDAGYASPAEKDSIVERRRREALLAYGALGVRREDIVFFDLPDLSLMTYVNRRIPGGEGITDEMVGILRARKATRAIFSSPHLENWDHTAVFNLGAYAAPQAGDPILADLGDPHPLRTFLSYSVWGDFEPGRQGLLRADAGILAGEADELRVREALGLFASQARIMDQTVARHRESRRGSEGYLELYRRVAIRQPVDFGPYFSALEKCRPVDG